MVTKLGVYGQPSYVGGADTELADQLYVWHRMGIEIHVVPGSAITDPSLEEYIKSLAVLHRPNDFVPFTGIPVISFCKAEFLQRVEHLKQIASHTIWVNCMTWTFITERRAHRKGLIDLHIYQTEFGRSRIMADLKRENPNLNYSMVRPYFNPDRLPFVSERKKDAYCFGRISRDDPLKCMPQTGAIYDQISSPVPKEAIVLGVAKNIGRLGSLQPWVEVYPPCGISQQAFYNRCDSLVQTSACNENWPRVGMEAMSAGTVLVVYDNDGWRGQVKQGETGYLCKTPKDFIFYASHLAHHPELRKKMAENARCYLDELAGYERSAKTWEEAFNKLT